MKKVQENQDEDRETKGESAGARSNSTRRCRAASVHNQSERVTIWTPKILYFDINHTALCYIFNKICIN